MIHVYIHIIFAKCCLRVQSDQDLRCEPNSIIQTFIHVIWTQHIEITYNDNAHFKMLSHYNDLTKYPRHQELGVQWRQPLGCVTSALPSARWVTHTHTSGPGTLLHRDSTHLVTHSYSGLRKMLLRNIARGSNVTPPASRWRHEHHVITWRTGIMTACPRTGEWRNVSQHWGICDMTTPARQTSTCFGRACHSVPATWRRDLVQTCWPDARNIAIVWGRHVVAISQSQWGWWTTQTASNSRCVRVWCWRLARYWWYNADLTTSNGRI